MEEISLTSACDHAAFVTCLLPIPGQDGSRVAPWPGAAVPRLAHIVIVSSYLLASMTIHVHVLSRQGTISYVRVRVRVRVGEPVYCKPAISTNILNSEKQP